MAGASNRNRARGAPEVTALPAHSRRLIEPRAESAACRCLIPRSFFCAEQSFAILRGEAPAARPQVIAGHVQSRSRVVHPFSSPRRGVNAQAVFERQAGVDLSLALNWRGLVTSWPASKSLTACPSACVERSRCWRSIASAWTPARNRFSHRRGVLEAFPVLGGSPVKRWASLAPAVSSFLVFEHSSPGDHRCVLDQLRSSRERLRGLARPESTVALPPAIGRLPQQRTKSSEQGSRLMTAARVAFVCKQRWWTFEARSRQMTPARLALVWKEHRRAISIAPYRTSMRFGASGG